MQNKEDQLQGPLPPTNMDINEDSVRSLSQLLKRENNKVDELGPRRPVRSPKISETESEVPIPAVIRQDSIATRVRKDSVVSRTSIKGLEISKPKIRDRVFKVTVGLLFVLIVCGISVIFHFHELELHLLELSKKIQLNEDNRVLTIKKNASVSALIGRLGMNLPDYEWPYDCSDYKGADQTHKCLRWNNRAQLEIYYESRDVNDTKTECHSIHWQDLGGFSHKDCYLLDGALWTGGGLLWQADFLSSHSDVDSLNFITTVTPDNGAGQILEPFWISSRGVSIFVDRQIPLTVSVSNLTFPQSKLRSFKHIKPPPKGRYMCLAPTVTPEMKMRFSNTTQWLNYTICVGNTTKAVQQYAIKYKVPEMKPLKDLSVFLKPVFSAMHLSANFTQDDVTAFAKRLHESDLNGTLMINPGWENVPGDLVFDPMRFPDPTAMINVLHSYDFAVTVPVHPYVGVHSRRFGPYSDLGYFITDGAGKSPGLTRWKCHNDKEAIVAATDLTNPEATQDLQNRIKDFTDTFKPNFLSFYGGDAGSLPYMAYQSGPQINRYTESFAKFAANITETVFLQSAYSAQDINPFLMMPCENSTWDSLKILMQRVLTLGLIGYSNVVQGPIGGCDTDSISDELYIRWVQLGSFLPILHFSEVPGSLSSNANEVSRKMLEIRNTVVVPVILKLLNDTEQNWPLVRPLWWFEPNSRLALEATDQFMVGDDILVAPVVSLGAASRDIYFPFGHWKDGWDSSVIHSGPQLLKAHPVQSDTIPFFISTNHV